MQVLSQWRHVMPLQREDYVRNDSAYRHLPSLQHCNLRFNILRDVALTWLTLTLAVNVFFFMYPIFTILFFCKHRLLWAQGERLLWLLFTASHRTRLANLSNKVLQPDKERYEEEHDKKKRDCYKKISCWLLISKIYS